MQFTKAMIDLAKEIRRRAPADDKPAIKLANPELFSELRKLYQTSKDTVSKALIKELFSLAGDPWSVQLEQDTVPSRAVLTAYRGQTSLITEQTPTPSAPASNRSQRIYRGQVVHG